MNRSQNAEILRSSPNPAMAFLRQRSLWIERDLLTLGTSIFNLETAIKTKRFPSEVTIPLSRETIVTTQLDVLREELESLVLNVLLEHVKFQFRPELAIRRSRTAVARPEPCESVCLFSGGVDSFSGILNSAARLGQVAGVSVIHGDQPWGSHIIDKLTDKIDGESDIRFFKLFAPPMHSRGYSQLRGFLYCMYGGVYLSLLNAKRLLITEVGPTMYQPRFSPYDSVTMTTHPFVLKSAKRILELVTHRTFDMMTPFENMTKSEVVVSCPMPEGLPLTHSCISLRFGRNEGTCYGCVVRRLGFLVAGVKDTVYDRDPLGNFGASADNVASLLRFSYDVLADYPHLLASSKENIENFEKQDLFRRFALDTYAALYSYKTEVGALNPYLVPIYEAGMERLTETKISKRLSKVRKSTFRPNFSKYV